jgi:L-iditol 2-dehydrogenase
VSPDSRGQSADRASGTHNDRDISRSSGLFPIDLSRVCVDEKDLLGSYSADFTLQREVAKLVFSRQLDVRSLITHRFPLAETAAAVNLASKPTPDSLKIIVCP